MPSPAPNTAIFYHPEAYHLEGKLVMGRQSAGSGFLNSFLRHSGVDVAYCCARSRGQFDHFCRHVEQIASRPARWIPLAEQQKLAEPGCLYHPGPDIARYAWARRHGDQRAYSLVGVTHTICTARIMEGIAAMLTAPLQPWDALICTSQAARQVIQRMLSNWSGYLRERLGATSFAICELPVIPLGVDCDTYQDTPRRRELGQRMRRRLGIEPDDVAALFVGRMNYHAKAHPLPMFRGLEIAAQQTRKRVWLILVGRFPSEQISQQFTAAARAWCPTVRVVHVDAKQSAALPAAWFAADLFTSLSDNIQETFGLTPVEAMAAGLPQVVSDWNGYRETVRHGMDGFRIPTAMPATGGEELAVRYFLDVDNFDAYIGLTAQLTAVDVNVCADAYRQLIENPDLRASMGQAGRERARQLYDWSVIIRAYQDLWAELAARRQNAAEIAPRAPDHPAHPYRADPFVDFACYPTQLLDGTSRLQAGSDLEALDERLENPITNYAAWLLLSPNECRTLLEHVSRQEEISIDDVLRKMASDAPTRTLRTIAWMLKANLLKLTYQHSVNEQ